MQIITAIKEMQEKIAQYKHNGMTIGFVPTMGFLHEGHLSLVQEAKQKADLVVMSIFVNPLQFGPNEDYDRYPRDIVRDEQLAKNAGVDILFYPEVTEMYKDTRYFHISVSGLVDVLCGSKRPGHFDGVVTVLIKLFNIVLPTYAFFGKKDAQQVAVVMKMVEEFNFPIKIIPVETVREEDGLAKSSRNVYLTSEEKQEATVLYKSLQLAKTLIEEGETNSRSIIEKMTRFIQNHSQGNIDYIEIYSFPNLKPLPNLQGHVLVALAVRFTNVRLIDNILLEI
ncbi:pantoate--beta-alanine ligase [Bacillus salitolerans]|uniref:Pantothenate synthetase n=1 Tax=Bacillus salitolerans TaxID=1437434 RepID=A0ABW4LVK1_9BACI